jgi:hypothetical protein
MTGEEFTQILDEKGYVYEISGDKIDIQYGHEVMRGVIRLTELAELPEGFRIIFSNPGNVFLESLVSLPARTEFVNWGFIDLENLTHVSPGVKFRNTYWVWLNSLRSIPPGVEFGPNTSPYLKKYSNDCISQWPINIGGISFNKLLNKMISLGLFDKEK